MKLTDPIIPGFRPTKMVRILMLLCFLLFFYFVPTRRTCNRKPWITDSVDVYYVKCLDPPFVVSCRPDSLLRNKERYQCRTPWHRPVVTINGEEIRKQRCQAELGEMAGYEPYRGCFCDYHTELLHGLCRMTDAKCQELSGTGAYADIDPSGLGVGCTGTFAREQ